MISTVVPLWSPRSVPGRRVLQEGRGGVNPPQLRHCVRARGASSTVSDRRQLKSHLENGDPLGGEV